MGKILKWLGKVMYEQPRRNWTLSLGGASINVLDYIDLQPSIPEARQALQEALAKAKETGESVYFYRCSARLQNGELQTEESIFRGAEREYFDWIDDKIVNAAIKRATTGASIETITRRFFPPSLNR